MNKLQKVIIGLSIAGAVGVTYVVTALRGMPEVLDWEDEDYD